MSKECGGKTEKKEGSSLQCLVVGSFLCYSDCNFNICSFVADGVLLLWERTWSFGECFWAFSSLASCADFSCSFICILLCLLCLSFSVQGLCFVYSLRYLASWNMYLVLVLLVLYRQLGLKLLIWAHNVIAEGMSFVLLSLGTRACLGKYCNPGYYRKTSARCDVVSWCIS